jgi:phosphotransferase system HPr-like phosphotransfer protein
MGGGNDSLNKSEDAAVSNLTKMYRIAHKYGAKVIAISNPTKDFTKNPDKYPSNDTIADWVESQTISDFVIPANRLTDNKSYFGNDFIHLNRTGQDAIYKQLSLLIDLINNGVTGRTKNIDKLHTKLKKLGFDLGDEINLQVNGPKTTAALKKLKQQYEKEGGTGNWSDNIGKLIKGIVNSSTVQSILAATKSASDSLGFTQTKKDKKIAVTKDTDAAKVITFFKQKGLTVSQSAGIAGNIAVESEFNPTAIGDNGTSYGLAQWHLDRWENLKQWCSKNGYEPSSISGQLEFLWWELQNYESSALSDLKRQTNPADAAESFASKFERPSYVSPIRAKNAENFYNDFTKYAASKI